MNTPLAARWASFSRSFSRSNCIGHYLNRMPSVPSSFKCDVSREMNYMAQATWLRTKGNEAAIVTASMAIVLINSTALKDFDRGQDGIVGVEPLGGDSLTQFRRRQHFLRGGKWKMRCSARPIGVGAERVPS